MEAVRTLLAIGHDPEQLDATGNTPFMTACLHHSWACYKELGM